MEAKLIAFSFHEHILWTFVAILFELNFIQTHFICCECEYGTVCKCKCVSVCICRQQHFEIFLFYRKRQVCMRLPLSLPLNYSWNYSWPVTVAVYFLWHTLLCIAAWIRFECTLNWHRNRHRHSPHLQHYASHIFMNVSMYAHLLQHFTHSISIWV